MPDRGDLHIDVALTNVSVGYKNAEFIGDQILPVVPVNKSSDIVRTYGKEAFRLDDDIRANGAESNRVVAYSVGTTSYSCQTHSLNDVVTDKDRANADKPINPDIDTTEGLTDKILLRREYDQGSYLFNTSTFSGTTTALSGTQHIDTYKDTIQNAIGREPNIVAIGYPVYVKLKNHPDILDRLKYTTKGVVTPELLAELFQVDKVLVGKSIYNSAREGQTASMSRIWGKYVLLAYVNPKPSLKSPTLGYTFQEKIYGGKGWKVKKWRREELEGDEIEVSTSYDVKLLCGDAGYLLSSVVS